MGQKDEILRKLTTTEYKKLIEIYKNKNTPFATRGLNYLITQKKLLDIIEERGIQTIKSDHNKNTFYTHKNGNLENGTFISISGTNDYTIFLCSLQESKEEMKECIFQTNLIEWRLGPILLSTEEKDTLNILEFVKMKSYDVVFTYWNVIEHQSLEKALQITYDVPENIYLAPLKLEDCVVVNSEWPHRYDGSLDFVQECVTFNGGLGLFSKNDHKLLCWVVINENGSPGYVKDCRVFPDMFR